MHLVWDRSCGLTLGSYFSRTEAFKDLVGLIYSCQCRMRTIYASSHSQETYLFSCKDLASLFLEDLLDSLIVDVASEYHRITRLGLDHNLEDEEEELRLSCQHKPGQRLLVSVIVAWQLGTNEIFECMNCGISIMTGRFAPHREKCMGK
ncbi:SAGA complex, Sgf11 subunit, partial [Dillenia turbinata]